MAIYAMIQGNMVTNIIVTEDKEQSEKDLNTTLVEITSENSGGIGWFYDAETGKFVAPPVPEEPVNPEI